MRRILVVIPIVALLFIGCSKSEEKVPAAKKETPAAAKKEAPAARKEAPAPTAAKLPAEVLKGMVLVEAGKFHMGSPGNIEEDNFFEFGFVKPFFADATPMHEVHVDAFYIDRYEVNNEEYKQFIDAFGGKLPPWWKSGSYAEGMAKRPRGGVSWYEAKAYCWWRGKRLPIEAEWEKAARGTDRREFPWGNDYEESKANVAKVSDVFTGTLDVDSMPEGKSPYGVYNMAGNVWEWTDSWYQPYEGTSYQSDRFGEEEKVIRGNSSDPVAHLSPEDHKKVTAWYSRTYYRSPMRLKYQFDDVGFRCAWSAK